MKNIVLIGFMGTGKTSVGKLLANRLGYGFVDTDAKIEEEAGRSIPEIFASYGEKYFRDRETEAAREAARLQNTVISTGGGIVLRGENLRQLRQSGVVIGLTASLDIIVERTERSDERPLLENLKDRREAVRALMEQRRGLYKQADYTVDTGGLSPLQVVEDILDYLKKKGDLRA